MREMKHYLDLADISDRVRKKQSMMIRICIMLAVFLSASIFSMADMEIRSQIYQTVQANGSWQAVFTGLTEEQEKLIQARAEVKDTARLGNMTAEMSGCTIDGIKTAVSGMDANLTELLPLIRVQEGSLPAEEDEAAVTETAAGQLGIRKGSRVTLNMPEGQDVTFTVTGILEDASGLNSGEAVGLFVDMSAYERYFAFQDAADTMLLVRFGMFCNVEKTVDDICAELDIDPSLTGLNAKLLALQFQSSDTYMAQLYAVAAILAVLVTTAGILMISGSMNSSVARRIRFFGMMRCLGADQRQVRRFVRREALNWCRTAIPLGLGISIVVVWGLCAVLRAVSPAYFSGMQMCRREYPGASGRRCDRSDHGDFGGEIPGEESVQSLAPDCGIGKCREYICGPKDRACQILPCGGCPRDSSCRGEPEKLSFDVRFICFQYHSFPELQPRA